jgi:hypothetical protein
VRHGRDLAEYHSLKSGSFLVFSLPLDPLLGVVQTMVTPQQTLFNWPLLLHTLEMYSCKLHWAKGGRPARFLDLNGT